MKRARLVAGVVLAAGALAGVALAQESRGVSKTEIVLGMHTDLSGPAATYGVSSSNAVKMRFDEINDKGGIHGRKIRLIVEDSQYQVPRAVQAGAKLINRDRIFAMVAPLGTPMNNALFKELLDGIQIQADKLKIKIVETTTHKPTDQDFTAQITRLKAAGCDLVVLGTIVRDSIVPYATARKIGWTDVDFLGSAASYDLFVAAAQGGVTEGLYAMGLTDMPYRGTLSPAAQAWFDRSKERYQNDPTIGP